MSAIILATLAAIGFSGASLLALLGGELRSKGRSYSAAIAAGILLALCSWISYQVPVGISLAAVLVAARATRAQVIRVTVLLGLAIPLAAALTGAFRYRVTRLSVS